MAAPAILTANLTRRFGPESGGLLAVTLPKSVLHPLLEDFKRFELVSLRKPFSPQVQLFYLVLRKPASNKRKEEWPFLNWKRVDSLSF